MKSEDIARYVAGLEEEVERLRAALPVLPEVGPVTRGQDGTICCDGDVVSDQFTADHHRAAELRWLRYAARRRAYAAFLDAEEADTAPDTSRVTFGARHEGTGMVLLQHADLAVTTWYGSESDETASWHEFLAKVDSNVFVLRAAHAALAEVREALNTAEAAGVDVRPVGVTCENSGPLVDHVEVLAQYRATRFLAREVQALVDQGLRGDDLNAAVPFEVRDHRTAVESKKPVFLDDRTPGEWTAASLKVMFGGPDHEGGCTPDCAPDCNVDDAPVEADDTSSDDEDALEAAARAARAAHFRLTPYLWDELSESARADWRVVAVAALDAHRAARTSEEQA